MILPQELEVWYVIPAIRKELAISLAGMGLKHSSIACMFGVTEACISNYFKSKRAQEVKFSREINLLINESAKKLSKGKSCFIKEVQCICKAFKKGEYLCSIHKKFDDVCKCKGCLA